MTKRMLADDGVDEECAITLHLVGKLSQIRRHIRLHLDARLRTTYPPTFFCLPLFHATIVSRRIPVGYNWLWITVRNSNVLILKLLSANYE